MANFLLVRGPHAFLSGGWSACSQKIGWNTEHLDADYGKQTPLLRQLSIKTR